MTAFSHTYIEASRLSLRTVNRYTLDPCYEREDLVEGL
jgi:hypothetical protein